MPIVAMNRKMPSWFTSLRSTIRSTAQATSAMTRPAKAKAAASASPNGQCHWPCITSRARTSASAAVSTIAPWAKLNTPEALKISTKPSATKE